ncbi:MULTISPECIES: dephospho-CoA kinase [Acinetobacter]|uniref:Dephospho-CoA kinase n=2 Tax=Acinetobacter soli TaxID=487316 RepID=A0AB38YXK1_9GAMM|nr:MULTISPECIES: dephospho-CoA kinase [Acinetobacter]ENV58895.1 dephospho-CoA kinase [Acinetobacter soli CIP 110264]ENV61303.1 dephospho-CoA kinase [Acinetobacter soli NIPH 2899]KQC94611.1 dephospho-CoA kinase [Acinetobacter soli]MBO3671596.1 dephospho-CoA kinase [Acinetobacter soli]MBU3119370.1 dephospho-CoA kinase [Acinetobacter soli]
MPYIVGLTGGIGSGKSAASQWFEHQDIDVVDADVVAREVVQPGQPALEKIAQHFGDWVLQADGQLDRRALRDYIFQHPEARQQLEAITHPIIRQSILSQLQQAQSAYVILVSPLLFETGQDRMTHRNLLVDVSEATQLKRASQRDAQSTEQIQKIIATQMPRSEKLKRADDVVHNEGTLDELYQQLMRLHTDYLTRSPD